MGPRRGPRPDAPCPTDRRVVYGELTPEGRTLVERVFEEHAALLTDLCAGLSPAEQETTAGLVRRLGLYARAYQPFDGTAA